MPRLLDVIPDFKAETTKGPIQFYEWQGTSWVLLFSHPSDFTPVCTTELGRLAVHYPQFQKRNVKLLGHSCDPLQSHVDWVNDIKNYCQDIPGEFPYPIIADASRDLAVKLDMIDAKQRNDQKIAKTVRALYVVDPKHVVRLIIHYPATVGRNVDEIIRVVDALQVVDKVPVATPANWLPGDKVVLMPDVDDKTAKQLFKSVETIPVPSSKEYLRYTKDY